MSRLFYGSINLTELLEQAGGKHSAFSRSPKNNKVYGNIQIWLNDEPDKFGNIMSMKLSATKEALEADEEQGKIYIGNLKESEDQSKPLGDKEAASFSQIADDLPF